MVTEPKRFLKRAWVWAFVAVLLTCLALLIPFFVYGCASGHDFEFHVASWLDVAYQWHEGTFYPRWTAWTNYGFGEPRYIFYPPLSWMLGAALTEILPGPWVPAGFILLTQMLAGMSAFCLLRRLVRPHAAILGAAFYAGNPYALLISYVRTDFAEQLACAFLPLLLLAAWNLCIHVQNRCIHDSEKLPRFAPVGYFALSYAAIWLCNAPAAVIASYAVALLFAMEILIWRSWRLAASCVCGLALGLGLAAFYIVPAAYEQRWVNIAQSLSVGLQPAENFLFTYTNDVEHTWFNWIASACALLLILLTGAAALASRTLPPPTRRLSPVGFVWSNSLLLAGASTFLMLRVSAPLWPWLPKLRFVQFPWRWMSILALVAACFLAAVINRPRGWLWFAVVAIGSIPLGIFYQQNTWWDPDEMPTQKAVLAAGTGYEGTDEYDPLGDDRTNLVQHAPLAQLLPASNDDSGAQQPKGSVHVNEWATNRKEIAVDTSSPARLALRVLNYPAWRVTRNGTPVAPTHPDDTNQMLVPLPAGRSLVQVRFARTPDRTIGNAVSLFSGVSCLGLLVLGRKRV